VRSELGSGKASALLTTTVFKIVGRTGPSVVGYDKALQKIAEAQAHEDARWMSRSLSLRRTLSSETLFRISGEAFEGEHHRADKTGWIKVLFEGAA
jgi:hypothetical protein